MFYLIIYIILKPSFLWFLICSARPLHFHFGKATHFDFRMNCGGRSFHWPWFATMVLSFHLAPPPQWPLLNLMLLASPHLALYDLRDLWLEQVASNVTSFPLMSPFIPPLPILPPPWSLNPSPFPHFLLSILFLISPLHLHRLRCHCCVPVGDDHGAFLSTFWSWKENEAAWSQLERASIFAILCKVHILTTCRRRWWKLISCYNLLIIGKYSCFKNCIQQHAITQSITNVHHAAGAYAVMLENIDLIKWLTYINYIYWCAQFMLQL